VDILHDSLGAGEAVRRGVWTDVIGVLVRYRWVGWGRCLMLGGGRHGVGCAVVLGIAWGRLGAILWVHKPVVVSVGGLSEGVVVARDVIVEPSSIWFPWGHVVPAWAVVGVIRMVGATLEASAAVAVTRVL